MRIAVCRPQVPFNYGGAELVSDTLVEQLRARGHEAELVSVPENQVDPLPARRGWRCR